MKEKEVSLLFTCRFSFLTYCCKTLRMRKILIIILLLEHLHYAYTQNTQYDSVKNLISSAKDDSARISLSEILIWGHLYSYPDSAAMQIQQDILLAQKIKSFPIRMYLFKLPAMNPWIPIPC